MTSVGSSTEYFEIDSEHVGARFGISVSLPSAYGRGVREHPLVYATDGNLTAPLADALRTGLTDRQRPRHVEQYIQVSVGYTAADIADQLILRNRDLVPPGEAVPEFMPDHIRTRLAPESAVQRFFAQQREAAADRFLAFLETELHPRIAERYRFRDDDVGLFGFSYGGLFTLYAMTASTALFSRFGASSPGIVVPDSTIYTRYEALQRNPDGAVGRSRLHLTLNSQELLGPSTFYRHLAIESLRLLDLLCTRPLPGLDVTTELVSGESHGSGLLDAYRSFLRACYPGGPV